MQEHGKKYREQKAKVETDKLYSAREAVALAKATSYTKFDGTVEVHMRLGVDPKHADQNVRDVVVLPHGLGKVVRVLVFADGEGSRLATEAGADHVADDAMIKRIQEGWADFDVAIATPDMMGKVGRLGRVLGPRGLMPNPKTGTVVPAGDLPRAIREAKAGRVEYNGEQEPAAEVALVGPAEQLGTRRRGDRGQGRRRNVLARAPIGLGKNGGLCCGVHVGGRLGVSPR